jgi:hypothetical protein
MIGPYSLIHVDSGRNNRLFFRKSAQHAPARSVVLWPTKPWPHSCLFNLSVPNKIWPMQLSVTSPIAIAHRNRIEGRILDASRHFDATTQTHMIALAIEYRQAEKNTPPVRSKFLNLNERLSIFRSAWLGLYNKSAFPTQLCFLSEITEEL